VEAINNNDYEMIQGSVLFMAVLYVLVNLAVDIVYLYINPKVSYASERRGG
jgi:peptide/nickel transport system permease protein